MRKISYKRSLPETLSIRDVPEFERPRERLYRFGADKLKDSELLAILLGTGTKGESVLVTAQKLLTRFGSLHGIAKASLHDLQKAKGVGPGKAAALAASFRIAELLSHADRKELSERIRKGSATDPDNAAQLIRPCINDHSKEQFVVASFDTRNRLIGVDVVSTGTLTASLVHPREVFEAAIRNHAACIIAAHNHPSGDTEPSEEDIKITKRLSEAGKLMGIELLDHLIITKESYCSFKEKGLM